MKPGFTLADIEGADIEGRQECEESEKTGRGEEEKVRGQAESVRLRALRTMG